MPSKSCACTAIGRIRFQCDILDRHFDNCWRKVVCDSAVKTSSDNATRIINRLSQNVADPTMIFVWLQAHFVISTWSKCPQHRHHFSSGTMYRPGPREFGSILDLKRWRSEGSLATWKTLSRAYSICVADRNFHRWPMSSRIHSSFLLGLEITGDVMNCAHQVQNHRLNQKVPSFLQH